MLQQLQTDPSNIHKRLGDGYYEQNQVAEQLMALTGKHFSGDFTNDDAQYRALMDNGVAAAKAFSLRLGIELSGEQVAQLTTDIVWLVEQTVTLKDGSKQTILVPKVYVRNNVKDIKDNGGSIAANNVDLKLSDNLGNEGQIVAHNVLNVKANNILKRNGATLQGNFVKLDAQRNV